MRKLPTRRIDLIDPGCYRIRRVRRGPWIPVRITVDDGMITVSELGEPPSASLPVADYLDHVVACTSEGEAFRDPIIRVAWFGQPITEEIHAHMLRLYRWACANDPRHHLANPDRPIDMARIRVRDLY
jgi:hypothetical protein